MLFPFLASHYGFATIYLLSAILCILCAIYSWRWLYQPKIEHTAIPSSRKQTQNPLKRLAVWRIVLAIGILCAPQFAIITFATVFLHDYGKIGMAIISISLAVIQIGAIISRIWAGRWTDKWNNRKQFLRVCSLLSVIAFLLLALEVSMLRPEMVSQPLVIFSLIALIIIAGIFVSAWHGVAYTELATLAGVESTGTALAMGNTVVYGFFFITPVVIPLLISFHGWQMVWFAASLCALVALMLFPKQQQLAHQPIKSSTKTVQQTDFYK